MIPIVVDIGVELDAFIVVLFDVVVELGLVLVVRDVVEVLFVAFVVKFMLVVDVPGDVTAAVFGFVVKLVLLLVVVDAFEVLGVVIVVVLGVVRGLPMVVVTAAVLCVVLKLVVVDVADLLCDVYVVVLGFVVDEGDVNVVVSLRHVKQQFTAACCPEQSIVPHVSTLSPYSQPNIFVVNFLHEPQHSNNTLD